MYRHFFYCVIISVSVQTVLSLPKNLPHEVEEILQNFCTYTQVTIY